MKKVLIISYDFPPVNNIAARRYGEMVSYMANFGWEPFVITTKSSGDLAVEIPEENIIRTGEHYQKGLLVEPPGVEWFPKFLRPGYLLYKKLNLNLKSVDRFLIDLTVRMFKKLDYIRGISPDIILASYGPATCLWLGNLLSRRIKKPWIADFRDACSLPNSSISMIFDRSIDKLLVSNASGIITVSPSLAYFLANLHNKKTTTIFNGFRTENIFDQNHKDKPIKDRKKIIYYAGRFLPNQIDSIKLLIKWLSHCGRDDIVFNIRSLGFKEMNTKISNYAKDLKVADMINILEPVDNKTIKRELAEADILTVFVDLKKDQPTAAGTITGKFLKLLTLGIPILVIGRKDSDIGKVLNETKAGFLVSSLEQLDITMKKILSATFMLHPIWGEIQKYSSENQCKNLCRFLDQIIAK